MSTDQNPTTDPTVQTPPATDPAPTNDVNTLPEWARKAIEKGNTEAASYRTKLRDAETKLSAAKSQEDIDTAVKELRENNTKLERDLLVATVGAELPAELRELLKGNTEAELKAHAEVLKKFAPGETGKPDSLKGGLNPTKGPDDFDPEAFADDWSSGRIERASISGRLY